jgi:predicted exporter
MPRPRREAVAFALLVLAATGFSVRRARLGGDIAHFLPDDGDPVMVEVSRALAASDLSRTLLVVLEGADPARVRDAAGALARSLQARPEVARVYRGVQPEVPAAFNALYRPRALAFFDDGPPAALHARLTDGALRDAARALRRRLASPAGALHARTAPGDPLGAFDALITRAREAQGAQLRSVEGQLVTRDERAAVLLVTTRASAFDAARQRPLLSHLDGAFARLRAGDPSLRMHRAGAHPITVAAEAQTRHDAQRISMTGSLGVALLFLALHRSPRYLALAALPVAAGTALAFAACLGAFGAVHGLTLAFGASLIGVTFDYPVYLINHHTLRPDAEGPAGTLRRVWPGLRLGALTTVGGLLGMGLTSFPGLRELALFAAVGVLGALVATRVLVAPLLPSRPIPVALQRRLAVAVSALVAKVTAGPGRWIPAALVLPSRWWGSRGCAGTTTCAGSPASTTPSPPRPGARRRPWVAGMTPR